MDNCQAAPNFACLSDGSCLPHTTFTWREGNNTSTFAQNDPRPTGWDYSHAWLGDFNGDGKLEQISTTNTKFLTSLSNGNGTFATVISNLPNNFADKIFRGDSDGDGKTDMIASSNGQIITMLSNGDGTFRPAPLSPWPRPSPWNNTHAWSGDFNGDGRTDLVSEKDGKLVFAFSNGDGSYTTPATPAQVTGWGSNQPVFIGDFNGDGKADLVNVNNGFLYAFSNGDGTISFITQPTPPGWNFNATHPNIWMGDFNGDGKMDLLNHNSGNFIFAFSKGDGSYDSPSPSVAGPSGLDDADTRAGDFNGDGKADLINHKNGVFTLFYSDGNGGLSTATTSAPTNWDQSKYWSLDHAGDGKADLTSQSNSVFVTVLFNGPFPDLMTSIATNLGGTIDITYKAITDNSVYTKGSGANYPVADIQLPVYVVDSNVERPDNQSGQAFNFTYTYAGARFSLDGRRGLGFHSMTTVDEVAGVHTINYFNQDFPLTGLLDLSQIQDDAGTIFSQLKNKYTPTTTASPKVFFSALTRTDKSNCDENGCIQTATSFEYDPFGNQTRTLRRGMVTSQDDVSFSGDERDEQTEWVTNTANGNWLHRPKHSLVIDPNLTPPNNIVREKWLYYDNQDFDVLNGPGLLTKEEKRAVTGALGDRGQSGNVVTTFTNDPVFGNRDSITDPIGCVTKTTLFDFTNTFPAEVKRCFGEPNLEHRATFDRDPRFGVVTRQTDANEQPTTFAYDSFGRLITSIGPKDSVPFPTESRTYLNWGNPVSQRIQIFAREDHGQSGTVLREEFFDGLGRIYKVQSDGPADFDTGVVQTIVEESTFDSRDLLINKIPPRFLTETALPPTTYEYDVMGRQTSVTYPDLRHADTIYEPGTMISIDENGHTKIKFLNAYDEIEEIDEINHVNSSEETYKTFYDYDAAGSLVQVTQRGKNNEFNLVTTVAYNPIGRKTETIDPNMGRWTFEYDKAGNLVTQIDPNLRALNQSLTFQFDKQSRMTKKVYPNNGGEINFFFDTSFVLGADFPVGRLTKIVDLSTTTILGYDEMGRVTQNQRTINGHNAITLTQTYNALSKVTTESFDPDSDTIDYAYDAGWLKSITEGATAYVSNIGYNARGQKTKIAYGNNLQTTISYFDQASDPKFNFLPKSRVTSGGQQNLGYLYDNVGNITDITDSIFTARRAFGYDDLNRLTSAGGAFGPPQNGIPTDLPNPCSYSYDALGNIQNKCGIAYTYGDSNHPSAVTSTSDGKSYTYDANGNTLTSAGRSLAWTPDNRVASVTNGGIVSMDYDSTGIRVKKTLGNSVTFYPFSGYEIEPNGTIIKRFKAGNEIVAAKKSPSSGDPVKLFYHDDHLGGINVVTDQSGARVELNEYDPLGVVSRSEPPNESSSPEPDRRFTGKELDEETDLYYYDARYYDQNLARFASPDPVVPNAVDPQTLNRYSYVANNPVTMIDPTGHDELARV